MEILENCHTVDGSNIIDHYIQSIYVCRDQSSQYTVILNSGINISRHFDKHFLVSIITFVVFFFTVIESISIYYKLCIAIVSSIVFMNYF